MQVTRRREMIEKSRQARKCDGRTPPRVVVFGQPRAPKINSFQLTRINRATPGYRVRSGLMKQLFAALIFTLIAFVALSGAAPNSSGPSPLERVEEQIAECIHLH